MKSLKIFTTAIALSFTFAGVNSFSGEITGGGKSLKTEDGTLHGASECAYSGLNDFTVLNPGEVDPEGFGRTQSWGQIPKELRDFLVTIGLLPGDACNPHKN